MAQSVFLDLDQGTSPSASIIPAADNTYDLGSATFQWRSIYLGTSAVMANAATISWTDAVIGRSTNALTFGAGGSTRLTVSSTALTSTVPITANLTNLDVSLAPAVAGYAGLVLNKPSSDVTTDFGITWKIDNVVKWTTGMDIANADLAMVYDHSISGDVQRFAPGGKVVFGPGVGSPTSYTYGFTLAHDNASAGVDGMTILNGTQGIRLDVLQSFQSTVFGTATYSGGAVGMRTNQPLIFGTNDVERMRIANTGEVTTVGSFGAAGAISKAGGITSAGTVGVPVVAAYGNTVAATNTGTASIATVTPAVDTTYEVSANCLVTTSTTHSFSLDVTYTDEGNTARTLVLPVAQLAGSFLASGLITNVTGAGPYESTTLTIRVKASTAVTIRTSAGGTYTTVVYNARGVIKQVS